MIIIPKDPEREQDKDFALPLIERIKLRKTKLDRIADEVKSQFVGIDPIIDSVIANMTVWHAMPELITRPVIINLWGMTGVGKTDMVRKLVKAMGMTDRFVEIQMSNKAQTYETSIQSILNNSSIEPDMPGILLLDEIQRYRTVDQVGAEIHNHDFQDLWMLLSDGRFAPTSRAKADIMDMLLGDLYWMQRYEEDEEEEEENLSEADKATRKKEKEEAARKQKRRTYQQSYYSARHLKKRLRLKETVEEIMKWGSEKKTELLHQALQDQSTFEGDSYAKLLIFISGNLDEAYKMSHATDNADMDADVFRDFSSKINLVTIKRCLRSRFKPEQISRMGNVHVIYPSLGKDAYKGIIDCKVQEFIDQIQQHNVYISVDQSVKDCIYRNGVFPAQGVRPVLSTISSMLGNSLPGFVMTALEAGQKEVAIRAENGFLLTDIKGKTYKHEIEGSVDKIKTNHNIQHRTLTAVHETGHAVVYAVLFRHAPVQIVANASADHAEGFVGCHSTAGVKSQIIDHICMLYAGTVAEEWVFGPDFKCLGCHSDLDSATKHAAYFIRNYGMDGYASVLANPFGNSGNLNYDIDDSNKAIEQMLVQQRSRARQILGDHRSLFNAVVDELLLDDTMKPERFQEIAAEHNLHVNLQVAKATLYPSFDDKFEAFKGNQREDQNARPSE